MTPDFDNAACHSSDGKLRQSASTAVSPFKVTDHLFMSDDGGDDICDKMMVDEERELRSKDFAQHTSLSISTLSSGIEIADNYS